MGKWTGPEDPGYAGCGEEGRRSFRLLRDLLSAAEPDPDSEDLSEWQLSRLTYVRSMSEWDTALRRLGPAVDEVPVVAVTCLGEPEPTELLISDYRYHIAVLRLTDLEATECPLEPEEKAVPRDLKRWLADPSVAIVASDEGVRLSGPPHCLTVTSVVSSDEVMRSQRRSGLIRGPDEDCGLQKQLSWATDGWRTLRPINR